MMSNRYFDGGLHSQKKKNKKQHSNNNLNTNPSSLKDKYLKQSSSRKDIGREIAQQYEMQKMLEHYQKLNSRV